MDNVHIKRAHRVKNKQKRDKKTKPRTIVCQILSYKQKKKVLKNANKLKVANIFINQGFCYETVHHRKELWQEDKRLSEAFARSCSIRKGILRNFTKFHRKTPVPRPDACNFIKKETMVQVFSCEFCEISKNIFFTEHLRATASRL